MPIAISSSTISPIATEGASQRMRLDFLDGLRGLAALYVVQYHIVQWDQVHSALLTNWMSYGHYPVGIFIVLSGYCLMLPVASSATGTLRGGIRNYLKRRAWRIIPPYYIALALTLILIAATQMIKHIPPQSSGESGWSVFAPANLLLHLTLLHNLSLHWSQTIDPPMWSVGLEWQIYFLFPLLLLPLWQRVGAIAAMAGTVVLSIAPHFLLPPAYRLDYVCPWFVGLFAMGMAGAAIGFSNRLVDLQWRHRLPWGTMTILLSLAFVIFVNRCDKVTPSTVVCLADLLIGLATLCVIIFCAQCTSAGSAPLVLRFLSWTPCVKLGQFSYSLYLIHLPVYWLIQPILRALRLHGITALLFQLIVGVPLAIAAAYLFYRLFERRFMSKSAIARSQLA